MEQIKRVAVLASALVGLTGGGCATLVRGSSQSVTINTYPPRATCALSREGNTIAVVNPTPGTVNVEKDKDAINVVCKKAGYLDNAGTITSEFQEMTFGNIIFGGLIGVAVDAGSGAMHQYTPLISITLIPEEFESAEHRDAFFDRMRKDFLAEAAMTEKRIAERCTDDTCQSQLEAAERATETRLAEIEKKRLLARVAH